MTYNVYSDSACTDQVSSGTPETITTAGTLPASSAVTLGAGTYYWRAIYSGDTNNVTSTSTCGSETETVTAVAQPTSVSTTLSGGGQSGASISVPANTAVTDAATLSGTNAAYSHGNGDVQRVLGSGLH